MLFGITNNGSNERIHRQMQFWGFIQYLEGNTDIPQHQRTIYVNMFI